MARQKATESPPEWKPNEKQILVLEAAKEAGLQRSISAIALETGVARQTIHTWLREDPNFRQEWEELPRKCLRNQLPGIYAALIRKAIDGDVHAIKLALEVAKEYVPTMVNQNNNKSDSRIKLDLSILSTDEVASYRELLAKLRERAGAGVSPSGNGAVQPQAN